MELFLLTQPFGNSLNGISSFDPRDTMLVGESYTGRMSGLRLWSTVVSTEDVRTHFSDMSEKCQDGIGSSVIAFWDFSVCTGNRIPTFKGVSCGILTNTNFKWIPEIKTYALNSIESDAGTDWVGACSAQSTCRSECIPTVESTECWFRKNANGQYLIVVLFGFILLVVLIGFCCARRQKESTNEIDDCPKDEEECDETPESCHDLEDKKNEGEIFTYDSSNVMRYLKPVYIPLQPIERLSPVGHL